MNVEELRALKHTIDGGAEYGWLPVGSLNAHAQAGYVVEYGEGVYDPSGNYIGATLTPEGRSFVENAGMTDVALAPPPPTEEEPTTEPVTVQPTVEAPEEESQFEIYKGGELPQRKRGGVATRGSKYPFDKLDVSEIFFVPKTDKMKKPDRTLAAAASSFAKRRAVKVGEKQITFKNGETRMQGIYQYPKKFRVAAIKKGETCGEFVAPCDGAVVMRIDVES